MFCGGAILWRHQFCEIRRLRQIAAEAIVLNDTLLKENALLRFGLTFERASEREGIITPAPRITRH